MNILPTSKTLERASAKTASTDAQVVGDVLALSSEERTALLRGMPVADVARVFAASRRQLGTPYGIWQHDPNGFGVCVLGEHEWSKQREIGESVTDNRRTSVYSCHASGKTHKAGRLVLWHCSVWPLGTALAVTTAAKMRSVKMQIWPHIRTVHKRARLLGRVDVAQWWALGDDGVRHDLAYGFSPGDYDESAVRGIHAPHLLIVVDEAGDMNAVLGRAWESITTGAHTRLLVIGNPNPDLEGTWFEKTTTSENFNSIQIAADDTPNFTDEDVPEEVKRDLIDEEWVDDQIREHGAESSWVTARVKARFPKGATDKVVPSSWVESARVEAGSEFDSDPVGAVIRLGVDIAADGGDELAIARAAGMVARLVHHQSGEALANAVDVAGIILEHIHDAERLAEECGSPKPVRVKIDGIGLGWGVAGILERWKSEGRHKSEIVVVDVRRKARNAKRYSNQRSEMWYGFAELIRPEADDDPIDRQRLVLVIDDRTAAQFSGPKKKTSSDGRSAVEDKPSLKQRGLPSPDRAEAVMLATFEPKRAVSRVGDATSGRIPTRRDGR